MELTAPNIDDVIEAVDYLRSHHAIQRVERNKIRQIVNGGADGIEALLGSGVRGYADDVPAPNLILSGLDRLAQKLGRAPTLKVDVPATDSNRAQAKADRRHQIVTMYDELAGLDLQLPQVARWLPGYGYAVWIVKDRLHHNGHRYPVVELRDPFDCYPSPAGPHVDPTELACIRRIPKRALQRLYPEHAHLWEQVPDVAVSDSIRSIGSRGRWEGVGGVGIECVEFYTPEWVTFAALDPGVILEQYPNPLQSGPPFVVAHRFAFDRHTGQYDQIVGLVKSMAKLNVMAVIAAEDNVFTETNIYGDLESGEYNRGRFAINYLSPGSRVEKPMNHINFQLFQETDRIERQARMVAGYPISDDGQSPMSFVTGRGLEELGSGASLIVKEYQTVLRRAIERLDALRLEWDETVDGDVTKPLAGQRRGDAFRDNYRPGRDIAGDYGTRRVYGMMAGWDEPAKIVTGIQLLQNEILDPLSVQEEIDGIEQPQRIRDRIRSSKTEAHLYEILAQRATQLNPQTGAPLDPKAASALVEIMTEPDRITEILTKYHTPQEPQLSPEEEQFFAGPAQPPAGPVPDVTTVLSRLEQSGGAEGGIQTVNQV